MDDGSVIATGMNPAEFQNIASAEDDLWWYRGQRDILLELIERTPAFRDVKEVFEAGCGTGHTARFLAERYGWCLTPMDLSDLGLDYARRRGLSRLIQGDITRLPIGAAAFDALISLDVIAHLGEGEERHAFREFCRVLRPGGLLLLRTAALDCLRSKHSDFILERQRFTRSYLMARLEEEGFKILFASYVNALLLPVAWLKFRIWEPLWDAPLASGVAPVTPWLNSLLGLPLAMESQWIRRGGSFPVGQTLLVLAEAPG